MEQPTHAGVTDPTAGMPRYQRHKIVRAVKIDTVGAPFLLTNPLTLDRTTSYAVHICSGNTIYVFTGEWVLKHDPRPGGYLVAYEDGYWSYSPAEAFEARYTLIA